jgi:hypothetical protein
VIPRAAPTVAAVGQLAAAVATAAVVAAAAGAVVAVAVAAVAAAGAAVAAEGVPLLEPQPLTITLRTSAVAASQRGRLGDM